MCIVHGVVSYGPVHPIPGDFLAVQVKTTIGNLLTWN